MLDLIKNELIDVGEDYIVLKNGNPIYKTKEDLSLNISNNGNLKVIHIIDQDTKISYNISKNINVKFIEIFYSIENSPKIIVDFNILESSNVHYLSLRHTNSKQEMNFVFNINLDKSAKLEYRTLSSQNADGQVDEHFRLNGEMSEVDMKNVIINSTGSNQEFSIRVYHNTGNTTSKLLNFGICNNASNLKINSTGIIKQGSHKSELSQRAKGLILDMDSLLSANPLLEIDDFDCIANHGASIGAIDEDELYYLMSRGLTKDESEKLIINGFISPVLKEIPEGKFQDYIMSWINLNI